MWREDSARHREDARNCSCNQARPVGGTNQPEASRRRAGKMVFVKMSKTTTVVSLATLAGVLLGAAAGYLAPEVMMSLAVVGQLFVSALKVVILPLIVVSVVLGVASLGNLKKSGRYKDDGVRLYVKAFNGKIIPIFLTVMSTVLGLVPFLAGGDDSTFWFSLAVGTMGGLVFSILAMIIFLPAFMKLNNRITE